MFVLFTNTNLAAFHLFYRTNSIISYKDMLYLPNLPNVEQLPYGVCLGKTIPAITTSDPNWDAKLVDYFWNSSFTYEFQRLYDKYAQTVPDLEVDRWETLSAKRPEAMLSFPWIPLNQSIDDFAQELITKFLVPSEGKTLERDREALATQKKKTVKKFQESLEEELFFLSSALHFPQDSKKQLSSLLNSRLNAAIETSLDALHHLARDVGKKAKEIFTTTSEKGV